MVSRLLLLALLLCVGNAVSAPTDLDPSFGLRGIFRLDGFQHLDDGALLVDGRLVVVLRPSTYETSRVIALDLAGQPDATFTEPVPRPNRDLYGPGTFIEIAGMLDGRFALFDVQHAFPSYSCMITVHLPSGLSDASQKGYLSSGVYGCGGPLSAGPRGELYVSRVWGGWFGEETWIHRIEPGGAAGTHLGDTGLSQERLPWTYRKVVVTADGRPVSLLTMSYPRAIGAARLFGSSLDVGFGVNGIATALTPEQGRGTDIALASDGVLVAGIASRRGIPQFVVARFTSAGQLDHTFGEGGLSFIEAARAGEEVITAGLAVQPDGKTVVVGTVLGKLDSGEPFPRIAVARLTVGGKPDQAFAPAGVGYIQHARGAGYSFVFVRPDGRILIGGAIWTSYANGAASAQASVFSLKGGDSATLKPLREQIAIEYFHAGQGHYFVTSEPREVAVLDSTPSMGWTRTGQTFPVWDENDGTMGSVCRFWSDQTFAPKSSHFYTPYDSECSLLKDGAAWRFERNAFFLRLPSGTPGAKVCLSRDRTLFRAYNNGLSGAPNHRYTDDPGVLEQMIAKGWIMEGEEQTKVFACIPRT